MTEEELEKIEEAARWQENYDKQLKDIKKLQKACHKWFMRWREAKKDALYFDSSLQKQIEATLNLQKELNALRECIKDYGAGCYENGLRNGRRKVVEQMAKLSEKNAELKQAKEGKVVEHFEAYGQCRDSRRIADLEAQIEKMKSDVLSLIKDRMNDDIDQNIIERLAEKWEIKEND